MKSTLPLELSILLPNRSDTHTGIVDPSHDQYNIINSCHCQTQLLTLHFQLQIPALMAFTVGFKAPVLLCIGILSQDSKIGHSQDLALFQTLSEIEMPSYGMFNIIYSSSTIRAILYQCHKLKLK